jgi:hypothetical protein
VPRKRDQKLPERRREAPIRPVVFKDPGILTEDTVHLHLEQRVVQRLLARFRTQGFIHHDLSRACLTQVGDSIPRVLLLGRLSLYGRGAERLHEEIVTLAARWIEPTRRRGPLTAYAAEAESKTLDLLDRSLAARNGRPSGVIERKLLATAGRDVEELLPQLAPRAEELAARAAEKLRQRGEREARNLVETLEQQRKRVLDELEKHDRHARQLTLGFTLEEKRQRESEVRACAADGVGGVGAGPGAGGGDPRAQRRGGPESAARVCGGASVRGREEAGALAAGLPRLRRAGPGLEFLAQGLCRHRGGADPRRAEGGAAAVR